jgi:DNA-directed RNA polymerase subunit RPC12/RpoP
MARTEGSGWGGGVLLYQRCPLCGYKKLIYDPIPNNYSQREFKCTKCKERSDYDDSDTLIRSKYPQRKKQ